MHFNSNSTNDKAKVEITDITTDIADELEAIFIQKIYRTIGQNVKNLRLAKNMTQLELSQAIGHKSVSVISCAEICHKNYHFNIEHLVKIANALDVKVSDFFIGVDDIRAVYKKIKMLNE